MLTAQLKASSVLVALFLAISIGAKAVGALQPPNPALRGFVEGCENEPQPCWYGIVPGKPIAEETLAFVGRYRVEFPSNPGAPLTFGTSDTDCNVGITLKDDGQQVEYFFVEGDCNLQLGDVLTALGHPDYLIQADLRFNRAPMLMYRDGMQIWPDSCCHLSVYSHVGQMFLTSFTVPASPPPKWHGFIPIWRYCQLEPILVTCTP